MARAKKSRPRRHWRLFRRPKNRRLELRERSRQETATRAASDPPDAANAAPARPLAVRRATLNRRARLAAAAAKLGGFALTGLRLVALLLLLGGIGLAGYVGYQKVLSSTYFDIDKIVVRGARHALPAELRARIEGVKGRSIFRVELPLIASALAQHPWVERVRLHRQLPRTLRVEVQEHRVQASVLLGKLYLVSNKGEVFKRATAAEADGLTVITGPTRREFLADPASTKARLRQALAALSTYQRQIRPALSEVRVGANGDVTFFLRRSGTALRFGKQFSEQRLRKLDAVWTALGSRAGRARALYLDHAVRVNRVVVRMAAAKP